MGIDDNKKEKENAESSNTMTVTEEFEDDDVDFYYEVEEIVQMYVTESGVRMFEIKWKNYDSSSNTWEPEHNLNCPTILEDFLRKESQKQSTNKAEPSKANKGKEPAKRSRGAKRKVSKKQRELEKETEYLDDMKEERRKLMESFKKREAIGLVSDKKKDLFDRKREYQEKRMERNSKRAKLVEESQGDLKKSKVDEENEAEGSKRRKVDESKQKGKLRKVGSDGILTLLSVNPPIVESSTEVNKTSSNTHDSTTSKPAIHTTSGRKATLSTAKFKPSSLLADRKVLAISKPTEHKSSFTQLKRPISRINPGSRADVDIAALLQQSVPSSSKLPNIPKYGPNTRPASYQRYDTTTTAASTITTTTTTPAVTMPTTTATTTIPAAVSSPSPPSPIQHQSTTAPAINSPTIRSPTMNSPTIRSPVITSRPLPTSASSSPNRSPVSKQALHMQSSLESAHPSRLTQSPSVSPPQVFQTPPSSPPPPNQPSPTSTDIPSPLSSESRSFIPPLNTSTSSSQHFQQQLLKIQQLQQKQKSSSLPPPSQQQQQQQQQRAITVSPRRTDPRLVVDNMRKLKIQNSTALPTPFNKSCVLLKGDKMISSIELEGRQRCYHSPKIEQLIERNESGPQVVKISSFLSLKRLDDSLLEHPFSYLHITVKDQLIELSKFKSFLQVNEVGGVVSHDHVPTCALVILSEAEAKKLKNLPKDIEMANSSYTQLCGIFLDLLPPKPKSLYDDLELPEEEFAWIRVARYLLFSKELIESRNVSKFHVYGQSEAAHLLTKAINNQQNKMDRKNPTDKPAYIMMFDRYKQVAFSRNLLKHKREPSTQLWEFGVLDYSCADMIPPSPIFPNNTGGFVTVDIQNIIQQPTIFETLAQTVDKFNQIPVIYGEWKLVIPHNFMYHFTRAIRDGETATKVQNAMVAVTVALSKGDVQVMRLWPAEKENMDSVDYMDKIMRYYYRSYQYFVMVDDIGSISTDTREEYRAIDFVKSQELFSTFS
ncbi:hypothetical protein BD560DRAFT_448852 [Blakeslea trispora]|nr:hypothetical protein BD560DRAFT_448852 [Blakeslea trispora]